MKNPTSNLLIDIGLYNTQDEKIFNLSTSYFDVDTKRDKINCIFKNNLVEGNYYVNLLITDSDEREHYSKCLMFNVLNVFDGNYNFSLSILNNKETIDFIDGLVNASLLSALLLAIDSNTA